MRLLYLSRQDSEWDDTELIQMYDDSIKAAYVSQYFEKNVKTSKK